MWFEEQYISADGVERDDLRWTKERAASETLCVWFWKKSVEKRPWYQVTTDEVVRKWEKKFSDLFSFLCGQEKTSYRY